MYAFVVLPRDARETPSLLNEWPISAPHQEPQRTGFPLIGEASGRCVYVHDTWLKVFTPVAIAARAKVQVSNLEGTDRTCLVTICGSSIVARC
jgi:hypothetical protein